MTTKNTFGTELPEFAQQARTQFVSTVKQSQQLTLDAAKAWTKAVAALPIAGLPQLTQAPALPYVDAATVYAFDLTLDLINAQRDFTRQLVTVLTPVAKV
jgi:6-phosphogluconate dehydrogenase